jgi:sulfatase maturation enzyme AslB (radical SAM superfamily)
MNHTTADDGFRAFEIDDHRVLFDARTLDFYVVDSDLPLAAYKQQVRAEQLAQSLAPKSTAVRDSRREAAPPALLLNIANICNMKCTYCFARDGSYGRKGSLMTRETADRVLSRLETRPRLKDVTFFGDEPTLNFDLIKYFHTRLRDRALAFSMNTNGLAISAEQLACGSGNKELERVNDKNAYQKCSQCWAKLLCKRCPAALMTVAPHEVFPQNGSCFLDEFYALIADRLLRVVLRGGAEHERLIEALGQVQAQVHAI